MMKFLSLFVLLCAATFPALGQVPIPTRPDGYALQHNPQPGAPVVLEAFYDLLCPDSKASWPVVKQVIDTYHSSQVLFLMHTFPLPYHTWSFIANEGAHVIHALTGGNLTAVRAYTDLMFSIQESYYNAATLKLSTADIYAKLAADVKAVYADGDFLTELIGNGDLNEETRVSWKYGCSRTISGTPMFLVNGVSVMADASWALSDWQSVIDPILNATTIRSTRRTTAAAANSSKRHEPVAVLSASLNKAAVLPASGERYTAANSTCPTNTTQCEYEPKKFECCLKSEFCIKNVGCTCVAEHC